MDKKFSLADCAYAAFLYRNDLHFLHHHISGPNFLEIHEMLGEYYDKALEDFDYFSEQAIAAGEKLINVNDIESTEVFKNWDSIKISEDKIPEDKVVDELARIGNDYIEALAMCRENAPDYIQSEIDSIANYWHIAISYKNEQMR